MRLCILFLTVFLCCVVQVQDRGHGAGQEADRGAIVLRHQRQRKHRMATTRCVSVFVFVLCALACVSLVFCVSHNQLSRIVPFFSSFAFRPCFCRQREHSLLSAHNRTSQSLHPTSSCCAHSSAFYCLKKILALVLRSFSQFLLVVRSYFSSAEQCF